MHNIYNILNNYLIEQLYCSIILANHNKCIELVFVITKTIMTIYLKVLLGSADHIKSKIFSRCFYIFTVGKYENVLHYMVNG